MYRKETNDWLKFYDFQAKNEIHDQENREKKFHKLTDHRLILCSNTLIFLFKAKQ